MDIIPGIWRREGSITCATCRYFGVSIRDTSLCFPLFITWYGTGNDRLSFWNKIDFSLAQVAIRYLFSINPSIRIFVDFRRTTNVTNSFLLHSHIWACNFHIALNFVSRCTGGCKSRDRLVKYDKYRVFRPYSDKHFHVMWINMHAFVHGFCRENAKKILIFHLKFT
jgi:hypothetical protein